MNSPRPQAGALARVATLYPRRGLPLWTPRRSLRNHDGRRGRAAASGGPAPEPPCQPDVYATCIARSSGTQCAPFPAREPHSRSPRPFGRARRARRSKLHHEEDARRARRARRIAASRRSRAAPHDRRQGGGERQDRGDRPRCARAHARRRKRRQRDRPARTGDRGLRPTQGRRHGRVPLLRVDRLRHPQARSAARAAIDERRG